MSNSNQVTLRLIDQDTQEIPVPIVIGRMNGTLKCDAFIRSKEENKQLLQDIEDGKFEDDEQLLRALYQDVRGLGPERGDAFDSETKWKQLTTGKYGAYLSNALVRAYFESYGEALRKNSLRSRSR